MEAKAIFEFGYTYEKYRLVVDELLLKGQTTGVDQSESRIEFTKLNVQRMNRLDKTIHLSTETMNKLSRIKKSYEWLLIGDAWCGDCAQIIPVMNHLVKGTHGKIELRIISRDTFPNLIETYTTNGAKSIPKLLIMNSETKRVMAEWGPRPQPAQDIMLHWKKNKLTISWESFEKDLHLWYTKDKGQSITNELIELIDECENKETNNHNLITHK